MDRDSNQSHRSRSRYTPAVVSMERKRCRDNEADENRLSKKKRHRRHRSTPSDSSDQDERSGPRTRTDSWRRRGQKRSREDEHCSRRSLTRKRSESDQDERSRPRTRTDGRRRRSQKRSCEDEHRSRRDPARKRSEQRHTRRSRRPSDRSSSSNTAVSDEPRGNIQPSLIKAAGYPIEKHRVTTPDGYDLQMHRIPAGRRSARRTGDLNAKGKKAILIVHGLLGSSGDFVIMGPERSLAYLVADAGYDVWLANLRGNVYTTHTTLNRNNKEFWDFSFHEHGKYDVPAMIDKVLNVTGLDKIMYLGYSMGTTSFFTMMSQRPEYNEKLIAFVALGPAVYLNNVKPVANLALSTLDLPTVLKARGMLAVQPQFLHSLITNLCNLKKPETDLCTTFIYAIVGEDYEQIDLEMFPIFLYRVQPASWRTLEHFGKIAMTGVFTTFSGGLTGPVKPYNISNVKIPVSLLYGENDQLTEKFQIMRLAEELKANGVLEEVRPGCSWPKFNHLDFVCAKDVGKLFNKPLIKHIDQMYNKYSTV